MGCYYSSRGLCGRVGPFDGRAASFYSTHRFFSAVRWSAAAGQRSELPYRPMSGRVAPDDGVSSQEPDEKTIMVVNGETVSMMKHARAVKALDTDTSIDEVWEIDHSLAFNDSYVKYTSCAYLVPKAVVFFLPLLILVIPCSLVSLAAGISLPIPTDEMKRNTGSFILCAFAAHLLFLPAAALCFMSLLLDLFFYYLFGVIFTIFSGSKGFKRYRESSAVIDPYRSGPSIMLKTVDVFVCSIGQAVRNGALEHALSLTIMFLVIPWLKWYINANPWVYPLKERYVQQISTSLSDCGVGPVMDALRSVISRSRQDVPLAKRIDMWRFIPHYPYPPPGRRWAVGMQSTPKFTLLTHSTHASATARGVSERHQFVLSNCTERPIWRVMLWYSNPFHFLTGFVEASITNGQPSQTDKRHGGEHPMWLVTAPSPMLSKRDSFTGPGVIDAFFDQWLPTIVDECRRIIKGPEVAAQMHQEVVSKDGVSRPASTVGIAGVQGVSDGMEVPVEGRLALVELRDAARAEASLAQA